MNSGSSRDSRAIDPGRGAAELDLLRSLVAHVAAPGQLGGCLTERLGELSGAEAVILLEHPRGVNHEAGRVLAVFPETRRDLACSDGIARLALILAEASSEVVAWDPATQDGPAERLLANAGGGMSMGLSLRAGGDPVGALLLVNLPPGGDRLGEVSSLLECCAPAVAMMLRASLAQEFQQRIIRDRTSRLENRERAFRALFEQAGDGFELLDEDGRYVDVNHATCRQLGYPREALLGMNVAEIDPTITPEQFATWLGASVDGAPATFESLHRRQDGATFPVEVTASVIRFDDEYRVLCLVRDISGREDTEEELRVSRSYLQSVLDTVQAGVVIQTADGRIVHANAMACDILGMTVDDIVKRTSFDPVWQMIDEQGATVPGENHPSMIALRTGRPVRGAVRGLYSGDPARTRWLLINAALLAYPTTGEGSQVLVTFIDITDRRRAEKGLQESEAFVRAVMDHLPIGVAVNSVDPAVDFLYMNDNFPKFYETTRAALADADTFWTAAYEEPQFREEIRNRVLKDCASGDPDRMCWMDIPITRTGRETRFITARNIPVPEKQLVISTVWDVTERKRAEEEKEVLQQQLNQAQKMEAVGRLAGGVAHDFNNLLTVILGNADLAQSSGEIPDAIDSLIDNALTQIRQAAERGAGLTRQLLAFSRKAVPRPQVLNPARVARDMEQMLRRLIGEHIALAIDADSGVDSILVDKGQLEQVILNLVVNACDAMPEGGRLRVEVANVLLGDGHLNRHPGARSGPHVMIAVSDNGIGMSSETQERLFEPFFTTKPVDRGTGLGLATVYGIVTEADGHITVESELGRGSTLRVHLPAVQAQACEDKDASETERPGGTETVLVCEDERMVRRIIHTCLAQGGYTVIEADNGLDALERARKHAGPIDLLITDVVMPKMNGRELATALKELFPDVHTLFMSGHTADLIDQEGVLEGKLNFIQKPFQINALLQRVRAILDERAAS